MDKLKALFAPVLLKIGRTQEEIDKLFSEEGSEVDTAEISTLLKSLMTPKYAASDTNTRNLIRKEVMGGAESKLSRKVLDNGFLGEDKLKEIYGSHEKMSDKAFAVIKAINESAEEKVKGRYENQISELKLRAANAGGNSEEQRKKEEALRNKLKAEQDRNKEWEQKYQAQGKKYENEKVDTMLLSHTRNNVWVDDSPGYVSYAKEQILVRAKAMATPVLLPGNILAIRDKANTESSFYFPDNQVDPVTPAQLVAKASEDFVKKSPTGRDKLSKKGGTDDLRDKLLGGQNKGGQDQNKNLTNLQKRAVNANANQFEELRKTLE